MAIDRLIGILSVLLREEQTTAGNLAERFEVSVRTIQRDIDRLCRAGIPLRTARGVGGGISIMEGYGLDRTVLTDEDRGAILAGLRSLDSVSGTGYYRQLMERLPHTEARAGDDCVVIDLASWYGPAIAPRLALLKDACARRRLVSFTYCAPGGESRRRVEPCQLVFRWSSWYLHGWCRERADFRLFKLNRMLDLSVQDEGFRPRPPPSPRRSGSTRTASRRWSALTPPSAGGWWMSTARRASSKPRTGPCFSAGVSLDGRSCCGGCWPSGRRRRSWSRWSCGRSCGRWRKKFGRNMTVRCPI